MTLKTLLDGLDGRTQIELDGYQSMSVAKTKREFKGELNKEVVAQITPVLCGEYDLPNIYFTNMSRAKATEKSLGFKWIR